MPTTRDWLPDFAARIHMLVVEPDKMRRFRDALESWVRDALESLVADETGHTPSLDFLRFDRPLSRKEKYVLLAAVHDTYCPSLSRIWPEEWDLESDRTRSFWAVAYHLPEAIEDMQAALEAFLADVAEDLSKDSEKPAGHEPQRKKQQSTATSARARQQEWLAKAMLLVRDHPEWSDAKIAREVGVNPGTLSRSGVYKAAKKLARGSSTDRFRGYMKVDPDSGMKEVEAVAQQADPIEDRSDRGQPIQNSRYFREYCAECLEPMKVKKDQVGQKPLCDHCAE